MLTVSSQATIRRAFRYDLQTQSCYAIHKRQSNYVHHTQQENKKRNRALSSLDGICIAQDAQAKSIYFSLNALQSLTRTEQAQAIQESKHRGIQLMNRLPVQSNLKRRMFFRSTKHCEAKRANLFLKHQT